VKGRVVKFFLKLKQLFSKKRQVVYNWKAISRKIGKTVNSMEELKSAVKEKKQ